MNEQQAAAFKAASGDLTPEWIHLMAVGGLLAVLFLWSASSVVSVYKGWKNGHLDADRASSAVVRMVVLILAALFFFAN